MRKLSLTIGLFLSACILFAQQNPHGNEFKINCTNCHTTEGWKFSNENISFDHDSTRFKLEGQHKYTDCRNCHTTLIFSNAKTNCIDCHRDMHNNTVGLDCSRCHNSGSWLIQNVTEIHQNIGFPLLGAHNTAYCSDCHVSVSDIEFQPLSVECIACHLSDYQSAENPSHIQAGISTDCIECHKFESFQWSAGGFNHDFFPLTKGHATDNCRACHISDIFETLDTDCYTCHKQDFTSATNPSHQSPGFSTSCLDCHTTEANWEPAKFDIHDTYFFPVFSGEHRGKWDECSDCHTQPANYGIFECTVCHEHNRSEMDNKHHEVSGYIYNSINCLICHPNGDEND